MEIGGGLRRGSDRIIGGVCSGIAASLHVDVVWVRLAFVLLAFAQGIGVLVYVVLWFVMPETPQDRPSHSGFDTVTADIRRMWAEIRGEPRTPPPAATSTDAPGTATSPAAAASAAHNQSLLLGVILLVIGVVVLGNNTGFVNWSVAWPVFLIAIGAFLLLRSARRRT
ncbi:MAG: PspC domain-containing protein [Candidatus Dormibacteraceae bacterium]